MTIRKRRNPTPGYRLPPPYNPQTGEHANLLTQGIPTHCAMMQVAADDEFKNYVICRGYDPRNKRFYDYDTGNEDKNGFPVAKPYGNRSVGVYTVGEIFPAVIPVTRIGQTAGVAATSDGHPADLDEEVEILKRDDSEDADADDGPIAWLLLDSGGGAVHQGKLTADLLYDDTTGVTVNIWTGTPLAVTSPLRTIENVLPPGWLTEGQFDEDAWVIVTRIDGKWYAKAGEVQTVVTDYQIDGPNKKFQKKTRKIVIIPADDESDWTDIHTGGECP